MSILDNVPGAGTTPAMNDNIIATDLLLSAKTGVRDLAFALTEASSPEVRRVLHQQLEKAIQFHADVYTYMENKGLYNAKDFSKQVQVDRQSAQQVNQLS
ncbi:spore coat protein [Paenactinomyces guangxiensis]|uniref:Spore coat protein n=1 Tax=Paenactinomyces guangxiensis TaxID=1490290 RepID=A0A7W1WQH2_9BACL|nr:spore coat protein [Paenactinomyces guangxiensis]MBA4494175.1 spore coat protein [Paenactinomyces guangxiensis]MBH8590671.1 spore coat protein [Paenactinomyces guangxiensis]